MSRVDIVLRICTHIFRHLLNFARVCVGFDEWGILERFSTTTLYSNDESIESILYVYWKGNVLSIQNF